MQIDEYINILKKEYKAKVIDFEKDIRKYFSSPDMYDHCGKEFNVELVSEGYISSDNFITLIIEGKEIDPLGKFDWGTKAVIVFAEYDENQDVIRTSVLSSFMCDERAYIKLLNLLHSCKKNNFTLG